MATAARARSGRTLATVRRVGWPVWALLALTALAGAIRFHSFAGMLDWMRVHEMTPPLYFILARAWTHVLGTGEVGLRSLSALLGTAVVPLVYASGVTLRSRRLGLTVAAFAAVDPVMVWYSP